MAQSPSSGETERGRDGGKTADRIWYALIAICAVTVLGDLFYAKHGKYEVENIIGAYGWYGLIACAVLLLAATVLRRLVARPRDYYGGADD